MVSISEWAYTQKKIPGHSQKADNFYTCHIIQEQYHIINSILEQE